MKNGIVINGVSYRAVFHRTGLAYIDGCENCDLRKKCTRSISQPPCNLFEKKYCWVNFKKI